MITFITGPMFASKSTELLNRMERYYYAKKKILLVRPKKDTRDYFSHEKANDERLVKMKPDEIVVNDFQEIIDKYFKEILRADYKAIFIDEAFMIKDVWKFCKFERFTKSNPDIFFVGLLASSECEVFPEVVKLLPRCDEIIKLNAVCMECGTYPANYSYYCGSEKKSDILVGDNKYQCLCSSCYFKKKNLGPKIGWSEVEQDNICWTICWTTDSSISAAPIRGQSAKGRKRMKTIVVKWVPDDGQYGKEMRVIESDHLRFVKGSRFDFGFFQIATDEGYTIISLPY